MFDSSADIPRHACPVEQLVPIIGQQEVLRRSSQHVRAQEPAGGKYARRTTQKYLIEPPPIIGAIIKWYLRMREKAWETLRQNAPVIVVPSGTSRCALCFAFANGGPYMEVGVRRSRKNGILRNRMCKGVNYW